MTTREQLPFKGLTPAARPVDTYSRPAERGVMKPNLDNPLLQLGEALKWVNPKIDSFLLASKKEQEETATPDEVQQAVATAKADLNGAAQAAPSPAAVENQAPAVAAPVADAAQAAPKAVDNAAAVQATKVESKATIQMDETAKQNFTARLKQQYDEWGDFNADMTPDLDAVFNTKKMLSADDAKGALDLLVKMNREAITKITGGVQTHEKTIEMAKELADMAASKSFRDVLAPLSQFADNANEMAAQLTAGKQMMQWASDHVYRMAQRVEQGHGPQAEAEFLQAVDVLRDITGMVKGAQTAAARMTSAGRIVTDASGKLMIHPEDVLKIVDGAGGGEKIEVLARRVMSSGGNVRKVNHAVSQSVMGRAIDIHNEFWLSGILSGVPVPDGRGRVLQTGQLPRSPLRSFTFSPRRSPTGQARAKARSSASRVARWSCTP